VSTITFTDDELAAVTAAIRRTIETDRFPRAPRLDPLRSALTKLEPATAVRRDLASNGAPRSKKASSSRDDKTAPAPNGAPDLPSGERAHPKAPPPAKADKRARR
jgi:hypothetical protein